MGPAQAPNVNNALEDVVSDKVNLVIGQSTTFVAYRDPSNITLDVADPEVVVLNRKDGLTGLIPPELSII